MRKQVVAGVAGAGVFGGHHARKYADIDGVSLGAVYDIDADRAAALAAAYDAAPYTDYDRFLTAVEAVTIASPATTHFDLAMAALAAGRHVLIEKPIALDLDEADRVNALAAARGLVVQVGHQERFVFDAFGILSRRRKPRVITCIRRNPSTGRGEDVSAVHDLMIHDLDLLRTLDLGEVASIGADGDADELNAEIVFASGASAALSASRRAPARERRMRLVYDDGVIEIDFINRTIENSTAAALSASFDDAQLHDALSDPLGFGVSRFVDAVRGEGPPAISGADGRAALEWALIVDRALVRPLANFSRRQRVVA